MTTSLPTGTRNHTLDLLRGITIILVILGHITRTAWLIRYIWSFHIPVFFFISGYFFSPNKYLTFRLFLNKKIKRLLIPYFIFGLLTYLYWVLVESRFRGVGLDVWEQLFGLFYGSRYKNYLEFNGPLWFIPCLFSIGNIFYFVERLKKPLYIFFACILLFVFGLCSKYLCPWLPFGLCAASIGIVFYASGFFVSRLSFVPTLKHWVASNRYYSIVIVILLMFVQVFAVSYSKANLSRLETGNPLLYLSLAYLGIIISWMISVLIGKSNIIEWLGVNSLVLFALHGPVYRALVYSVSFITKVDVLVLRQNVLLCLILTVLTIMIIAPMILLWNKWGKTLTK